MSIELIQNLKNVLIINTSRRAEYLRQGITLGGLRSLTFQRAVSATYDIYSMFEREFEEGELDSLDIVKDIEGFGPTIELSNRILTPKAEVGDMEPIELGRGIDPHGVLKGAITQGKFIHGEDNRVDYYTFAEEGGKQR